jgi:hypothetical protein
MLQYILAAEAEAVGLVVTFQTPPLLALAR